VFVLRAKPVMVDAIDEVRVVALESWVRFWMNSYNPLVSMGMGERMGGIYEKKPRQILTLNLAQHISFRKPHISKQRQSHPKGLLLYHKLHFPNFSRLLYAMGTIPIRRLGPWMLFCDFLPVDCGLAYVLVFDDECSDLDPCEEGCDGCAGDGDRGPPGYGAEGVEEEMGAVGEGGGDEGWEVGCHFREAWVAFTTLLICRCAR